ncbi:MAG TPA: hypothetical protein VKT32_12615 [Chthonomonadaceae bacterium]|nr:hypothetical protein [Chthonomonadaceae bacterium]
MSYLSGLARRLARKCVFGIDAIQQRRHQVLPLDRGPHSLFRVSRRRSPEDRILADGTVVRRGDPIIEFHYWNERMPPMGPGGPDVAWGLQFYRRLRRSLNDLAEYARDCPEVVAVYGEASYAASVGWEKYEKFISDFGFEFSHQPATGTRKSLGFLFTHFYSWLLIWAANPASLRGRSFGSAERCYIWQSRQTLIRRHGDPACRRETRPAGERASCEAPAGGQEALPTRDYGGAAAVSSSGPLNPS